MPLLVLCGFPSSGKTTRANEVRKYLEQRGKNVEIVSIHSFVEDKNKLYKDSVQEKAVRASMKAAIERSISRDTVTILDSLNYIKGYRYELYCIVKSHKTVHCVIQTLVTPEECKSTNRSRTDEGSYEEEVLEGLMMRFETPDSRSRWDSPLFTVAKGEELQFETIFDALFDRKAKPPNQSTMPTPLSSSNFLYELDKRTQDVIKELLNEQKSAVPGDKLTVSVADEKVDYLHPWTLIELRKLKKQFITYTKMHPVEDIRKIGNMFIQFINNASR